MLPPVPQRKGWHLWGCEEKGMLERAVRADIDISARLDYDALAVDLEDDVIDGLAGVT